MEQKNPYACHHFSTFFTRNPRYDKHVENCSEKPGVVYRFENQNLVTFGDNLKYWGDLPFVAYCNFETTTTSKCMYNPEDRKMFPMSYVIIFAFLPT